MGPLLLILAIIPGLLICFLIFKIDKFEKEPVFHLSVSFLLGVLSCFPAIKLEELGDHFGFDESQGLKNLLVFSYIVIALSEELVKYLALLIYVYPKRIFNEPLDGILYAVMIGMGFATLENLLYADRFGHQTVLVRAFTAVPAHAVFAIFMGYYVGLAKFQYKKRLKLLSLGLLIPVIIHGTYDLFILQQYYEWLILLGVFTLYISAFFAVRVVRLHQQNSPFRDLFVNKPSDNYEKDNSGLGNNNTTDNLNPIDKKAEK